MYSAVIQACSGTAGKTTTFTSDQIAATLPARQPASPTSSSALARKRAEVSQRRVHDDLLLRQIVGPGLNAAVATRLVPLQLVVPLQVLQLVLHLVDNVGVVPSS